MTVNREELKAFIDGELSVTQAEAIRHEAETNNDLSQEVVFLKLIGQGVRDCAVEIPVTGAEEALTRFRKPKGLPIWQFGLGVLSVAVVSAALFPLFAQSKSAAKRTVAMEMAKGETLSSASNGFLDATTRNDTSVASPTISGGVKLDFKPVDGASAKAFNESDTARRVRSIAGRNGANRAPLNSPAFQTPPVTPGDQHRMVVQNGDLDEVVRDVSNAQNEAMDYVKALGGFIQSSSMNKSQTDTPEANLNVRIPARTFSMAMDHFKSLAIDTSHIKSVNVTGEDVTAQYADSTARMKVLAAEEDSYVTMLRGARRIGEIMAIKDRLSSVREQIESLKAQSEALKNESDLSTISLTFEQQPKVNDPVTQPSSWSSDSWTTAVNGLGSVLQFLATVLIFVFVYAPIWLPVALVGVWLRRRSN